MAPPVYFDELQRYAVLWPEGGDIRGRWVYPGGALGPRFFDVVANYLINERPAMALSDSGGLLVYEVDQAGSSWDIARTPIVR